MPLVQHEVMLNCSTIFAFYRLEITNHSKIYIKEYHFTLKMLGCFNPILGKIWTNPTIGLHF